MIDLMSIRVCPATLADGYCSYCPTGLRRLFDNRKVSHVMSYSYGGGDFDNDDMLESVMRISLSGVQEKYSVVAQKGSVVIAADGVQGRYIMKPIPSDKGVKNRHYIPANEHLTMQIARQVFGIDTAENGLIFYSDGYPAYLTKRFDFAPDGSKINQEDFASLIGKTKQLNGDNFKYEGSYEDIADEITRRVAACQVELAKFFDLVVFNYLFGNNDAHLKNFSLMQTVDGDYKLTPAYDLLNATLHVNDSDFALDDGLSSDFVRSDTYDKTGHPTKTDFETFGAKIGLLPKQIDKVVAKYLVADAPQKVEALVDRSFLDDKLKRMYKSSFKTRMSRFVR